MIVSIGTEQADADRTWTISNGQKRKTGIGRERLKEVAASGSLPLDAFIKPDDDSAEWQMSCTVEWLHDDPHPPVIRYCVECDSRVRATTDSFEKIKRCPNCGSRTKFIDYLQEEPPIDDVPIEPWGVYDQVALAFTYLLGFIAICSAISLFFAPLLAVFLSFVFLASGSYLIVVTYQHRSDSSKYRRHLTKVEHALDQRTAMLFDRTQKLEALRRSLVKVREDLIEATDAECQVKREKADENLRIAIENSGALDRIAARYLDEQRKWWTQKLRGDNYPLQKNRIEKAITFARKQGYDVPAALEREIMAKLKEDYTLVLRQEQERERQRRIREQIREEQRAEKAAREAQERAEAEQRAIEAALQQALAKAGAQHSTEVEELRRQLKEAEERGQRAISQAQLTKTGHVYVISNIGSFGENIFKIGLTRRLEPLDRINELGDASVPFPFDVHMMISSDDAPRLEHALHVALHSHRINKVNLRKEFFRIDIESIRKIVETHHGTVEYAADAEALQFRQTLQMSDEDYAFIEAAAEAAGLDFESDEE